MRIYIIIVLIAIVSHESLSQDIIYKVDQTEIKVKVTEIKPSAVLYKIYNDPDGKEYSISISDVYMIIYENGEKEVLKQKINTVQTRNQKNNSKITKDRTNVVVVDKRQFPIVIGDIPGIIRGTRMKDMDKKNKVFPLIVDRFTKTLNQNGFSSTISSNPNSSLTINISELYYKSFDNFTYIQIDQLCSANITLTNNNDNTVIYSTNLSSSFAAKPLM